MKHILVRIKKVNKFLFIVFVCLMLTACGWVKHLRDNSSYTKYCVDGVEYIQFSMGGTTVAYTPSGKIKLCEMDY